MRVKQSFVTEIKELKGASGEESGDFGFFEGYAATFDNIDRVDDRIEKGAFKKSLKEGRRIKLLWQHSNPELIGQIMDAKEDNQGLFVKGRINLGTAQGKEAYALLKAGDIDEMSIGFGMTRKDFEFEGDTRVIKDLTLYEISLVTEPANVEARVTEVKKLKEDLESAETLDDIEDLLQEKGFSRSQSCTVISKVKEISSSTQSDSGEEDETKGNQPDQSDSDDMDVTKMLKQAVEDISVHAVILKCKQ